MKRVRNMSTALTSWVQAVLGDDIPCPGDIFFLAPELSSTAQFISWLQANGVDETHYGTSFATMAARMTNGRNDVLVVAPGSHLLSASASTTWSKSYTHIVGACSPIMTAQRSRLYTNAATITPMITISGNGCVFKNIMFSQEGSNATTAARNIALSGNRNYFSKCTVRNTGALSVPGTAMRNVYITSGDGENYWYKCTIGMDTVDGDTGDPACLEYAGTDTARDTYEDCIFILPGAALGLFLKAGTQATGSFTLFKRCTFFNNVGGSLDAATQAFNIGGGNGVFLLQHCGVHGATALETSDSGLLMAIGAQATTTQEKFAAATGW